MQPTAGKSKWMTLVALLALVNAHKVHQILWYPNWWAVMSGTTRMGQDSRWILHPVSKSLYPPLLHHDTALWWLNEMVKPYVKPLVHISTKSVSSDYNTPFLFHHSFKAIVSVLLTYRSNCNWYLWKLLLTLNDKSTFFQKSRSGWRND